MLFAFAALGALAALSAALARNAAVQEISYQRSSDSSRQMQLLLKDWWPQPMLHLKSTSVPRAKFYVIDMHNHVNDAFHIADERAAADVVDGGLKFCTPHSGKNDDLAHICLIHLQALSGSLPRFHSNGLEQD
jgi:hypothetical protein